MGRRREGNEHQGRVKARGGIMLGKRIVLSAHSASQTRVIALVLALGLPAGGPATAQSYPDKPIKLVVPFPPGGPTDYVARLVAQHLSVTLGQVVIDNRPGAGGTIASKSVAGADPDGYTLLYGSSATLGIAPALYKNVDYDPVRSFAPIALVSRVPFVLGIAATLPPTTLAEFIAYAKANPGKLNFGATVGTPPHLVGELFKVTTGTDIFYVPYKGAAQAMTDLLAGEMHLTIEGVTTLLPHIQSGKVRPLAVMSPQRIPALPDVPTMIESGYTQFPAASWTGVLAPAGTPAAVLGKLNAAINQGLQSPEIRDNFARFNAEAKIGSPRDFADFIAAEAPKWAALVKASAAKLE
jgi:tripartite-type tricarboxylate transporter receptor subunit TctC